MSTSKTAWEIVAKHDVAAAIKDRLAAHMAAEIDKVMVKEMIRRNRLERLAYRLRAKGVDKDDAIAIAEKLLP